MLVLSFFFRQLFIQSVIRQDNILGRNLPKIIEALSADGSGGHQIEASTVDPLLGKSWVSPSDRYAIVPDESGQTVSVGGNGNDASVPESDVKRIRI